MANFSYQAINESGTNVSGIDRGRFRRNGGKSSAVQRIHSSKVAAASGAATGGSFLAKIKESLTRVKITDLILFTKQFRSMMQAGVPILRLLQVLENQTAKQDPEKGRRPDRPGHQGRRDAPRGDEETPRDLFAPLSQHDQRGRDQRHRPRHPRTPDRHHRT